MTLEQTEIKPPCFPARPANGGPLDRALPKHGEWWWESKLNGWRVMVHVPTRTAFNRHGELLSIAKEFGPALDALCVTLDAEAFKWVDCEALEGRHNIGRGSLVVFDVIPERAFAFTPFRQRRAWIEIPSLPELRIENRPEENQIYRVSHLWKSDPTFLWVALKTINGELGCEFYEGLVAKRADSIFPIQQRSASQEFPFWVKHRWRSETY